MGMEIASDEVTDAIASIEMHRQEMEKESGVVSSGNWALRKLHELLEHEREALRLQGQGAVHSANVEAITTDIDKVKKLAGIAGHGPGAKNAPPAQRQAHWRNAPDKSTRPRSRRTMGRSGR